MIEMEIGVETQKEKHVNSSYSEAISVLRTPSVVRFLNPAATSMGAGIPKAAGAKNGLIHY